MLLAQNQRRAGRRSSGADAGSPRLEIGSMIGSRSGISKEGLLLQENGEAENSKPVTESGKDPQALAIVPSEALIRYDDGLAGLCPSGADRDTLDLAAVDSKLVGLDWKIERIAGAVGAKIGSGVSADLSGRGLTLCHRTEQGCET